MLRCCKSEHFQERDPSCLWVAFATSWSQPYDAEAPVEPYNPIHWILSNYIPGQSWRGSCLFSPEFISESFGRPGVKGLSTFLVPLMWNIWSQSNVETVIAHWLLFVMFIEAERVDEKIVSWRISCNSWITATTRHVATRVGSFRNGLLEFNLICLFSNDFDLSFLAERWQLLQMACTHSRWLRQGWMQIGLRRALLQRMN